MNAPKGTVYRDEALAFARNLSWSRPTSLPGTVPGPICASSKEVLQIKREAAEARNEKKDSSSYYN